jgi:phosphohistidine phosphatase
MKQLLLLRHAKSDRHAGLEDFERPLNERGQDAAARMGEAMRARGYAPDQVLVSASVRTQQTWALLSPHLKAVAADAQILAKLYLAPANQIFEIIRQTPPTFSCLLLIGHNPGMEDLAARLANDKQSAQGKRALDRLARKFPTCGLAVLSFNIDDWKDLRLGSGSFDAFLTPATLED